MTEVSNTYTPATLGSTIIRTWEGHDVRIIDGDGDLWMVGIDVCAALGLARHEQAISRLDPDERKTIDLPDALGRMQPTTIISEAGRYRLIFTSRRPEAERFQRWLAHEVLPQIRKTGAYTPETAPAPLTPAPLTPDALREAKREAGRKGRAMSSSKIGVPGGPGGPGRPKALALPAPAPSAVLVLTPPRRTTVRELAAKVDALTEALTNLLAGRAPVLALPAPAFTPPVEWSGMPVDRILWSNLHLAGTKRAGGIANLVADIDRTPPGCLVKPGSIFAPGVIVHGAHLPEPGADGWTSHEWLHVSVSLDLWEPHDAGNWRATWLIGQIVARYQSRIEALRLVETARRKLPRPYQRHAMAPDPIGDEAYRRFLKR